jgi:hypothetical protein
MHAGAIVPTCLVGALARAGLDVCDRTCRMRPLGWVTIKFESHCFECEQLPLGCATIPSLGHGIIGANCESTRVVPGLLQCGSSWLIFAALCLAERSGSFLGRSSRFADEAAASLLFVDVHPQISTLPILHPGGCILDYVSPPAVVYPSAGSGYWDRTMAWFGHARNEFTLESVRRDAFEPL